MIAMMNEELISQLTLLLNVVVCCNALHGRSRAAVECPVISISALAIRSDLRVHPT